MFNFAPKTVSVSTFFQPHPSAYGIYANCCRSGPGFTNGTSVGLRGVPVILLSCLLQLFE